MKQLWAIVLLMLLLLAGCSSGGDSKDLTDGESIYGSKCAGCHGGNLKGAVGPPVLNMSAKYSEDELIKFITNGTNKMPGHLLTDEQTKIVSEWLLTQK